MQVVTKNPLVSSLNIIKSDLKLIEMFKDRCGNSASSGTQASAKSQNVDFRNPKK